MHRETEKVHLIEIIVSEGQPLKGRQREKEVCYCGYLFTKLGETPWTVTHQAFLFMGFPRQVY